MSLTLPLALSLVTNPRQNGSADSWKAHCPAHSDETPSLSLSKGSSQELILRCHAGCEYNAIKDALLKSLKSKSATYTYHNKDGSPIGRVKRTYDNTGKKQFYQSILVDGIWKKGSSEELKATPYHLPRVLTAIQKAQSIFIVEGEKDADRLNADGRASTCNVGGVAMGWKAAHSEWLKEAKRIFIIADNDKPGHKHAWSIYDSLTATGCTARISVVVSPFGKDISEHLDLGHSLKELETLEREVLDDLMHTDGWVTLSSFVFDSPAEVPAVWGHNGKIVLWAAGQGCMIVAPQGVGKTTLSSLLLEARLGLIPEVLGYPVQPSKKGVCYLAMDRPVQIAGAMRRIFEKHGRQAINSACPAHVWPKSPLRDFAKYPGDLRDMILEKDADTVLIDSLKDAVMGLSKEEPGQGWNAAVQLCLQAGIEVLILNHPVKRVGQEKDSRPMTLDDVYGNQWITAGLGSVLSLWGERDSHFAELFHLKQPAEILDPITIRRDSQTGEMSVIGTHLDWAWFFMEPRTVTELQAEMYPGEMSKPNYNKAKKQIELMLSKGLLIEHSKTLANNGGRPATRYVLRTPD